MNSTIAETTTHTTPTHPLSRIFSLARTGPRSIFLRFYSQTIRKVTGAPPWNLCRVTPQLYVGGQHYVKGWPKVQAEGITAVLNMRENHHDDVARGIGGEHHLHLPTRDNTPIALEDLQRGVDFITDEVARGGKVYVHCGVGVGRAPSMAAAYLISTGMSTNEAVKVIKKVRPFVHLTPGQKRRLQEYEQALRSEKGI